MGKNNEHRIEELLTELGQCREDERNTQNQILQILVTAATTLGILFGASFIDVEKVLEKGSAGIFSRGTFWVSVLIFLAAFCYIATLGMNNFLRYYYIQELEDRLRYLIPGADDDMKADGAFLHWNGFQAPLITRNQKHIASHYAALHFASYTVAILCAVLFSIMLLILQFLKISPRTKYDWWGISAVVFVMTVFLLRCIVTASTAGKMADFTRKTAHENLEARKTGAVGRQYKHAAEFSRFLRYLIYPKSSDLQKPFLIIIGFIGGIVISGRGLTLENCLHLIFVLIVFDILAYQARYQINDIRGIKEDHGRLMPEGEISPKYINISLFVVAVRIALAILLVVAGPSVTQLPLTVCLAILILSTIAYEAARKTRSTWGVYILVGPGYPLRVFLGLWIAYPALWRGEAVSRWQILFLGGALWAYGSFSSLLSWTKQVCEKMEAEREKRSQFPVSYKKPHFKAIQNQIMERYIQSENHWTGHTFPLREQGQFNDPWTIWYLLSLVFLALTLLLYKPATGVMKITEVLAVALFGLTATNEYTTALRFFALGEILTVISGMASLGQGGLFTWYMYICVLQIIVTGTYYSLRGTVQLHLKYWLQKIGVGLYKLIVGAETLEYMENAVPVDQEAPR